MRRRGMSMLAVATLCVGCTWTPQAVVITPRIDVPASRVGTNRKVHLRVLDERPRDTLGLRGGGQGAVLTVEGDLSTIVWESLAEGLTKLQFKPLRDSNPEDTELRVNIRNLDYTVSKGLTAGALFVETRLRAICIRDSERVYEQTHKGKFVKAITVVASDEKNNSYVSDAVSSAINSLLKDQSLLACLSAQSQ